MACFSKGTVLACAVEPCTNPAEIEVSIAGYGEYPPMVVRLCPSCATTFGKLLHDWPKPPTPSWVIPHGITSEDLDSSLTSYKEVITLSPPSTITIDGRGAVHTEAKPLRYPDYLSAAIHSVSDDLLDRLEADIRRIEAHPASQPDPEPEQHAPGWLPGDE